MCARLTPFVFCKIHYNYEIKRFFVYGTRNSKHTCTRDAGGPHITCSMCYVCVYCHKCRFSCLITTNALSTRQIKQIGGLEEKRENLNVVTFSVITAILSRINPCKKIATVHQKEWPQYVERLGHFVRPTEMRARRGPFSSRWLALQCVQVIRK